MSDRYLTVEMDRPRRLRLTIPALREVKRRAGLTLSQLLMGVGMMDVDALAWLIWAGARHEDPKITDEAAGDAVQAYLDAGNTIEDLVGVVEELAERSGILRPAEPDPPTGPGMEPSPEAPKTDSPDSTDGSMSSTG